MDLISKGDEQQLSNTEIFCSVCIANYNGEKYIGECIKSVLHQNVNQPIEIIVHDDASTDNSVACLESDFPNVKLIKSKKNVGFCISNNRMVEAAKGRNILLLNNDAKLHQNALNTLFLMLKEHGEGIYGLPQYDMETGELIDNGSLLDLFLNPLPNLNPNKENVGMVTGACLFTSKNLWVKLGGFPPWFESLAEDLYLCCLARLQAYPVKVAADSGFDHWVGKNLGGGKITREKKISTNIGRRAKSERNKTYVLIISTPGEIYYPLMLIHFCLLLLEGLFLCLIKWDSRVWRKIYFKTLTAVFENRLVLKEKRKIEQRKRKSKLSDYLNVFTFLPHKIRMLYKHGIPQIQ